MNLIDIQRAEWANAVTVITACLWVLRSKPENEIAKRLLAEGERRLKVVTNERAKVSKCTPCSVTDFR